MEGGEDGRLIYCYNQSLLLFIIIIIIIIIITNEDLYFGYNYKLLIIIYINQVSWAI